jgi:hypothetical protein
MVWIVLTRSDGKQIDVNMGEILCVIDDSAGARLTPIHRGSSKPDEIYVRENPMSIRALRRAAS